ncbi:hypothetical protein GCM10011428_33960 [Streptomyces violaceus]|uniref:helix-turn-helix transcriptional regulator n=1 Tax=Streptomyces violaceus TaxID=1936 RepID=UPI0031EC3808
MSSPLAEDHAALLASAAHLAQGHPRAGPAAVERVAHHRRACAVEAARVRLAAGHPEGALDLLDSLPENDRPGPAVDASAPRWYAPGPPSTPGSRHRRRLVARALLDGRRERLRRPFLEAGPWIRPLLSTGRPRELATGWLLPGPGRYRAPGLAPPDGAPELAVEELSARERDVVRRVAEMMSTEEIAADLHVSVNTVKTHLKSIYRKLAVTRRGEAVRRARERRLL